jgi:hypothetical protein
MHRNQTSGGPDFATKVKAMQIQEQATASMSSDNLLNAFDAVGATIRKNDR